MKPPPLHPHARSERIASFPAPPRRPSPRALAGKAFAARLDAFRKAAAPVAPEEGDKPAAPPPPAKKAAPPSAAAKEAPPTAAAAAKGPTEQSLSEGLGEQLPWEASPEDFAAGCLQAREYSNYSAVDV